MSQEKNARVITVILIPLLVIVNVIAMLVGKNGTRRNAAKRLNERELTKSATAIASVLTYLWKNTKDTIKERGTDIYE
ncbi:MAG: hypothetical protein J6U54_20230 [Clostridiales bacterium]|nr:hypothetical protein [Clostridiales bacterium]